MQQVVETIYKVGAGYLEQLAEAADNETAAGAHPTAEGEDITDAGEQTEAADEGEDGEMRS